MQNLSFKRKIMDFMTEMVKVVGKYVFLLKLEKAYRNWSLKFLNLILLCSLRHTYFNLCLLWKKLGNHSKWDLR